MITMPAWGRYAELRPADLAAVRRATPVAYLPWGGTAWRGPHLPLGVGGMIAESVGERAVRRTGGVIFPVSPWPLAGVPHGDTLGLSAASMRLILDELFAGFAAGGWQVVVLLGGHYSQGHDLLAMAAAEAAMARYNLLVLALPPLAIVDEEMLDHGALWETSTLLAVRPDLVNLEVLGEQPLQPAASGVVGRDPRLTASSSLGLSALNLAVERLVIAVRDLLNKRDPAPLRALYEQRRERYNSFVARYSDDPVGSVRAWWEDVSI